MEAVEGADQDEIRDNIAGQPHPAAKVLQAREGTGLPRLKDGLEMLGPHVLDLPEGNADGSFSW